MEKLLNIAKERRATKVYNGELIPTGDLHYIFEVTNTAPTSMGLEAWRVLSIRDRELKKELEPFFGYNAKKMEDASDIVLFISKKAEAFYDTPWAKTRVLAILKKIDQTYGTNKVNKAEKINNLMETLKSHDYGNNNSNHTEWAKRQPYIAIAYMMLAAKELDIDSTPIEGFSAENLNKFLLVKKLMRDDENVAIIVFLGYSASIENHPFQGIKQTRIPVVEKFTIK